MAYQYQVSYGNTSTGPWTLFATVSNVSDTVTGLAPNTSYFFQIVTVDTVTGISSTPIVSGPFTTSSQNIESTDGTSINSTSQKITSSQTPGTAAPIGGPFDTWTLSGAPGPNCQVVHNGTPDTNTSALVSLYYSGHFLYQQASNTNSFTPTGGTTGWWQWNPSNPSSFNGYVACASPIPTGKTITVGVVPNQSLTVPFAVSGLLQNYTSTPTLQYADNFGGTAGSFNSLPAGQTVSTTAFTFVHPAITTNQNSMTVSVRDSAATTVSGTSNTFSAANPQILSISLSSNSVPGGSPVGTVVGSITSQVVGNFTVNYSLSGTDFVKFGIVQGNQLVTASSLTPGQQYHINIIGAAPAGTPGSPTLTQAETITASAGQVFGPASTSNFALADFTNTTNPSGLINVPVAPQLFGVATGGITNANGNFDIVTNTQFQAAVRALNLPLLRLGAQFWNDTPAAISKFAGVMNKMFPSNCIMIVGAGLPSLNQFAPASTYQALSDFLELNALVPVTHFEVGNEVGLSGSDYTTMFNTGAQGFHATNSSYKVGGPVSAGWNPDQTSTLVNNGVGVGFLDFHDYLWCDNTQDVKPSDSQACLALTANNTNRYAGDTVNFVSTTNGTFAATIPWLIGEYGIECSGSFNDTRLATSIGVAFIISCLFNLQANTTNTWWGGAWDLTQDGGAGYQWIDSGLSLYPQYYLMQQLIAHMPGTMVHSTSGGGSGNLSGGIQVWATVNAPGFCVAIVNSNTVATQAQPVALSHVPVSSLINSSGTGTCTLWTYPTSSNLAGPVANAPGTTKAINVTNGVTDPIVVPALSAVLIYSS